MDRLKLLSSAQRNKIAELNEEVRPRSVASALRSEGVPFVLRVVQGRGSTVSRVLGRISCPCAMNSSVDLPDDPTNVPTFHLLL